MIISNIFDKSEQVGEGSVYLISPLHNAMKNYYIKARSLKT